jgi:hypothetical protein
MSHPDLLRCESKCVHVFCYAGNSINQKDVLEAVHNKERYVARVYYIVVDSQRESHEWKPRKLAGKQELKSTHHRMAFSIEFEFNVDPSFWL